MYMWAWVRAVSRHAGQEMVQDQDSAGSRWHKARDGAGLMTWGGTW